MLVNRWLSLLHKTRADFTLSFRRLSSVSSTSDAPDAGRDHLIDPVGYDAWINDYRSRLRQEASHDSERAQRMDAVNPLYVLRNHLAQAAIAQAQAGDSSGITALWRVLRQPFTEQSGCAQYAAAPPPELQHLEVSCSS
jgi:uncharacterized protein YdiU (UPF0061 family)